MSRADVDESAEVDEAAVRIEQLGVGGSLDFVVAGLGYGLLGRGTGVDPVVKGGEGDLFRRAKGRVPKMERIEQDKCMSETFKHD